MIWQDWVSRFPMEIDLKASAFAAGQMDAFQEK
jgi:hypothetical protein